MGKRLVINITKWNLDCQYPRQSTMWGGTMNRLIFRSLVTLSLLCFSLVAAGQVRADSVSYTYTVGSDIFTWTLPLNPVIAPSNAVCGMPSSLCTFTIPGASFTLQIGSAMPTTMTGTFDFADGSLDGGFDLYTGAAPSGNPAFLIDNFGTVLFTGPVTAPTLSAFPSGISLTEYGVGDSSNPDAVGTLTATVVSTTPTPEPSTLLLLATGLAIGLAITVLRKN